MVTSKQSLLAQIRRRLEMLARKDLFLVIFECKLTCI